MQSGKAAANTSVVKGQARSRMFLFISESECELVFDFFVCDRISLIA